MPPPLPTLEECQAFAADIATREGFRRHTAEDTLLLAAGVWRIIDRLLALESEPDLLRQQLADVGRERDRAEENYVRINSVANRMIAEKNSLQQQLAEARSERDETYLAKVETEERADRLLAQRDMAIADYAESRAALAKYGRHSYPCSLSATWRGPRDACTCGLAVALAATTPTASGS